MERSLRRKIRYFLSSHYRGRAEMHVTLDGIRSFGPTVVIGGILRDLALSSNLKFRSDVDLVVDAKDPSAFREHVILAGAEVNRFGGFRFQGPPWEIDVWLLEDTWANRKGHVEVKEFADLLEATFFNCDAVIYDPSSRKIVAKPSYFEDLYGRVLEVNLEPNPNPVGNAVRAFRYAAEKDFRWGPRLCRFISEVLEDAGRQKLIEYEWMSYRTQVVERELTERFIEKLTKHLEKGEIQGFVPVKSRRREQLPLPLKRD